MKKPAALRCIQIAAILIILVIATMLGLSQYLPEPIPTAQTQRTSDPREPSLDNALRHISNIAREPHVPDTEAQRLSREYICLVLEDYGLQPVVESHAFPVEEIVRINQDLGWRSDEQEVRDYANMEANKGTLPVTNIWARLDLAPDTDEAVLMLAHYDSVKFGPGAGDDSMSVATLLETARLLKGSIAKRDLILLFTDGEEQGMLGATLFERMHPEMRQSILHVTNVECRGCTGAILFFETSDNNFNLVRLFGKAVPHPVGNSIAQQVYRMMSSDTDFTIFNWAGYQGINLSLIDGAWVYHTADDNMQNLSQASLWHYLRTVPQLAGALVSADATTFAPADQDALFFPFFKGNMVVWPLSVAPWLGSLAFVWAVAVLVMLYKRWGAKPLLVSFARQAAALLSCVAVGFIAVKVINWTSGVSTERQFLTFAASGPIALALALLSVVVVGFVAVKGARNTLQSAAGLLPLLALFTLAAAFVFPGATWLLALPVLAQCACIMLNLYFPNYFGRMAGALLSILVVSLVLTPVAYLVYVALSLRMIYGALALLAIGCTMMFSAALPLVFSHNTTRNAASTAAEL